MYLGGGILWVRFVSAGLGRIDETLGDWEAPASPEHEGTAHLHSSVYRAYLSVVDKDGNLVGGEQDNDSWFIPMQYPERLPSVFYRNSDPEWQEFVKMSWDEQRKDMVRGMPRSTRSEVRLPKQRLTLTQKSLHRAWPTTLAATHCSR